VIKGTLKKPHFSGGCIIIHFPVPGTQVVNGRIQKKAAPCDCVAFGQDLTQTIKQPDL